MRRILATLLGAIIGALAAGSASAEPFARGHQLGFSLGTPAGLNLEYAYEFGRREISLSGAHYGSDLHGLQGGITLVRGEDTRKHVSVNAIGGYFYLFDEDRDEVTKWGYGGFEGALHYRAFFIAPAVTLGSGKFENVNQDGVAILGRLGFRWRL